jgi:Fe-S-cluster containining protein
MRRLRIAILGASPCGQCTSACCRQNGHDYAALLDGDEARRFAAYSVHARISTGHGVIVERVLPYVEGRCVFLGEGGDCLVYDDRPAACRAFECVRQFNRQGVGGHDVFLRRNPSVLRMLEQL